MVNVIPEQQNTYSFNPEETNMLNKILPLALTALVTISGSTVLSAALVTNPLLTPSANAQAQRYKVIFWYTIDGSDDGWLDNKVELYGDITVNGRTVRHINRGNAVSREAGQNLMMKTIFTNEPSLVVNASLVDRDAASADDPVFRMDNLTLNLASLAGRERTVKWRSGGGEGATLHMQVVRV
jgi:hypothetical protein